LQHGLSAGFRIASATSFSICFGVGMRQLAGRSVIGRFTCPVALYPATSESEAKAKDGAAKEAKRPARQRKVG
jgi:hypothetical protein